MLVLPLYTPVHCCNSKLHNILPAVRARQPGHLPGSGPLRGLSPHIAPCVVSRWGCRESVAPWVPSVPARQPGPSLCLVPVPPGEHGAAEESSVRLGGTAALGLAVDFVGLGVLAEDQVLAARAACATTNLRDGAAHQILEVPRALVPG